MSRYLPALLIITLLCAGLLFILQAIMDFWIGDGDKCAVPGGAMQPMNPAAARYAVKCSACDEMTCSRGNAMCGRCWLRLPEETRRVLRHSSLSGWTKGAIIDRAHQARLKLVVADLRADLTAERRGLKVANTEKRGDS